jgi:hypothetical protein
LVPIDFSRGSRRIAENALALAQHYHCSIHLLHVNTISPFSAIALAEGHTLIPFTLIDNKEESSHQLKKLSNHIQSLSNNMIEIQYSTMAGQWNQSIISYVNLHQIDLVLHSEMPRKSFFQDMGWEPDLIATQTGVPVISIPSRQQEYKMHSMVIPLTDFLPVRKLMYGIYIATKFNTTIKLLGIKNRKTKDKVELYLKKSADLIQTSSQVKVEQELVESEQIAHSINYFSIKQSADLIIVNPHTQTKRSGFFSSFYRRHIYPNHQPTMLTINPSIPL